MRRLSRAAVTALAALALLLAAPGADARRAITIERPAAGAAVDAYPHLRSTGVQVTLRGRAARGAPLIVRAHCALGPCVTTTVANRRGRWRADLHAVIEPDRRRMGIRVAYADSGLEGSDLVVPRLLHPAWAAALAGEQEFAMIGDSLAEGTAEPLRRQLAGWHVTSDFRRSRPLATGMGILDATPLPRSPFILAFSLFTNDDPRNVAALEAAVRHSVSVLRPGGCALWATIVRPPLGGVSYAAANDRLRRLALELGPALRVVDWAAAVRGNRRRWLARDGVHATAEGYEARAALYADAARACVAER